MFVIPQLWVRLLGTVICLVALFFFICPLFVGVRHAGCAVGAVVSVIGIVFFAGNPWVAALLQRIWETGIGHVVLCVVIGLLALGAVLMVAISVGMVAAVRDVPKEPHPLVVLGCKVKGDKPSLMLQRRLDTAAAYMKEHPEVPAIVCGGQGRDETVTEAKCMHDYLVSAGIDETRIVMEESSTSTFENLRGARDILEEREWGNRIILVTSEYHQLRASMVAGSFQLETDALSAKTSWYLLPGYWVRELLGVCCQAVFG